MKVNGGGENEDDVILSMTHHFRVCFSEACIIILKGEVYYSCFSVCPY